MLHPRVGRHDERRRQDARRTRPARSSAGAPAADSLSQPNSHSPRNVDSRKNAARPSIASGAPKMLPTSREYADQFIPNWNSCTRPVTTPIATLMTSSVPKNLVSRRYSSRLLRYHAVCSSAVRKRQPDRDRDEEEMVDRRERELPPREIDVRHLLSVRRPQGSAHRPAGQNLAGGRAPFCQAAVPAAAAALGLRPLDPRAARSAALPSPGSTAGWPTSGACRRRRGPPGRSGLPAATSAAPVISGPELSCGPLLRSARAIGHGTVPDDWLLAITVAAGNRLRASSARGDYAGRCGPLSAGTPRPGRSASVIPQSPAGQ